MEKKASETEAHRIRGRVVDQAGDTAGARQGQSYAYVRCTKQQR